MPSVKTQPLYALRQEFAFIDGLGTYVDEKESRTNARYNPWPKPNLTRIALLEKYAETWKVRAKDWQGHKLRESMRDTSSITSMMRLKIKRRSGVALQLTIEDGVPIPETTTRQGSNITFLKSMKPGQSTLFKGNDTKKAARFYRVAKKLGIPIEIHKVAEGLRMWRVEAPITEELK